MNHEDSTIEYDIITSLFFIVQAVNASTRQGLLAVEVFVGVTILVSFIVYSGSKGLNSLPCIL
jgi:hypothetical protein